MTTAAMKAVQGEEPTTERHGKHKLDELDASRVAKHLVLFRPTEHVVENLMAKARLSIPGLAATADVQRILRYNPDCMYAVARKAKFSTDGPRGEGFIAILPLTALGLQLLALDALNTRSPDARYLTRPGERPAGIYIWGVFAPGPLAAGVALFMKEMASPLYAGISLYTRPNTDVGRKFNEVLGLTHGTTVSGIEAPHLWVFRRAPLKPLYDTYSPDAAADEIGVTLARTFEDLVRVAAVRSAVYIGEQQCPYEEEFDGNDLAASHLLGYVGFYAARTVENHSDLLHFCFSCRTLGMGIEAWVYQNIGKPWLPVVGEVLSDPRDDTRPLDWISLGNADLGGAPASASASASQFPRVIIHGGCNALSIAHYFYALSPSVIAEVTTARHGIPIRLDHSLFLTQALDGITDEFIAAVEPLGYARADFGTRLFDRDVDSPIVILDFWTDSEVGVYRHKKLGFRIPFVAPYHLPVKPEENAMILTGDLSADGFGPDHPFSTALRVLRDEYEYEGLISEDLYKDNLRRILSNIAPHAKIILLAANEAWLNPGNGLIYRYPAHTSLNQWTAEVAREHVNTSILDVRTCFVSENDAETVNHFDRLVYFRIFQAIIRLAEENQPQHAANSAP